MTSEHAPETASSITSFEQLNLPAPILQAIQDEGYEQPSPIQAEGIPAILAGGDVLGQAQTGTGKTAAFALPVLANIDIRDTSAPQVLVLAPTRELAIQVAEAFQSYSRHLDGFHVLPVYGGAGYDAQLRGLRRGVHVVVGTPGRVMDHIKRKTLKLDNLKALVLDEADEMLRMGFIEDVEWILDNTPSERQIALFSATMPPVIRKVADKHLDSPTVIKIKTPTTTNENITQRYLAIKQPQKLEALTRVFEVTEFDAAIVFVRTKNATTELAEKLEARGYSSAALNGDIVQKQRERTIERLKSGDLDIVIATDVAARGIDVERVTLVVNYDIPYDAEAYTHRIGRTGRAGRQGETILFVTARERRMLNTIERTTRQTIEAMQMPTVDAINESRTSRFRARIDAALGEDLEQFETLLQAYQQETDVAPIKLAAALAKMAQGDEPLFVTRSLHAQTFNQNDDDYEKRKGRNRERGRERGGDRGNRQRSATPEGMQRYRIEVGRKHRVKPGNIVGAIANEAGMDSKHIGPIEIYDTHTTVDLPEGMPKATFHTLQNAWVCGQKMNIALDGEGGNARPSSDKRGAERGARDSRGGRDNARRESGRGGRPNEGQDSRKPSKRKASSGHAKSSDGQGERKKVRARDLKNKGKPKRSTIKLGK